MHPELRFGKERKLILCIIEHCFFILQEKKNETLKKCGKESESCGDIQGCGAEDEAKDCSIKVEEKFPEISGEYVSLLLVRCGNTEIMTMIIQ